MEKNAVIHSCRLSVISSHGIVVSYRLSVVRIRMDRIIDAITELFSYSKTHNYLYTMDWRGYMKFKYLNR